MDFFLKEFVKMPQIIVRRINGNFYDSDYRLLNKKQVIELLGVYDELILKISVGSGHGEGVTKIEKDNYNDIEKYGKNFVVQKILKQHNLLSTYNDSSVNIIRILTLNLKGEVYVLSGIFRIGAPGTFRDLESNGNVNALIVGLDDKGFLKKCALDLDDYVMYDNIFGKKIEGKVPYYEDMKRIVTEIHSKFSKYGIIGWDLTVDENDEIICIENNIGCPAVFASQILNGPFFGNKTKAGNTLLDEIRML